MPVNLLKNNPSLSHEMNLNNSIQTLEYEFVQAIHSLTLDQVPKIAFIEGHGELDSLQTHGLMDELKNFFQVDRGYIQGNVEVLSNYQALIVARPCKLSAKRISSPSTSTSCRGERSCFSRSGDSLCRQPFGGTTVALANPVGLKICSLPMGSGSTTTSCPICNATMCL
jgi:hypothetical protein